MAGRMNDGMNELWSSWEMGNGDDGRERCGGMHILLTGFHDLRRALRLQVVGVWVVSRHLGNRRIFGGAATCMTG